MAWMGVPAALNNRLWARLRARNAVSSFMVFSQSARCSSLKGCTYLTIITSSGRGEYATKSGLTLMRYCISIVSKNFWSGTYVKRMTALAKTDVLILDDWGLAPLSDDNRRDLLELLEDRHDSRTQLVTSQLPVEPWHEAIGEPTLADAILDRLVHNAYKIALKGDSMRKRQATLAKAPSASIWHAQRRVAPSDQRDAALPDGLGARLIGEERLCCPGGTPRKSEPQRRPPLTKGVNPG